MPAERALQRSKAMKGLIAGIEDAFVGEHKSRKIQVGPCASQTTGLA
jgi:hypothetical protein